MSAVREVKYLRELQHPNVIEVRVCRARKLSATSFMTLGVLSDTRSFKALGRVLVQDESEPRPRVPRHRSRDDHQGPQLARLSPRGHQELDGHDVPRSRILSPKLYPP
jgi:hypothetical protein